MLPHYIFHPTRPKYYIADLNEIYQSCSYIVKEDRILYYEYKKKLIYGNVGEVSESIKTYEVHVPLSSNTIITTALSNL